MKPIKMLGLAMVAALAAMAMVGVGNASALEPTQPELCKEANKTPCPEGQLYKFSPTEPLEIQQELKSPQAVLSNKSSLVVSCQESQAGGNLTEDNVKEVEGKKYYQLVGQLEYATWKACTGPMGETCTAEALQLPWLVHLNQKEPTPEQNNGDLYVGPHPGKEQPGAEIKCKTAIGTVACIYKSHEAQPRQTGEWTKLQVLGGTQADDIAEAQLKKVTGSSFLCSGSEGLWSAEYKTTVPAGPVYVTHQEE